MVPSPSVLGPWWYPAAAASAGVSDVDDATDGGDSCCCCCGGDDDLPWNENEEADGKWGDMRILSIYQ